jgi:hypothetical protein
MPTKVCIIDIDLGISIDDIIAEDAATLAGQAQAELDQAIEIAKDTQRVQEERAQQTKTANNRLSAAMEDAYQNLEKVGEIGLPVNTVMSIVIDVVPNSSAFTLRMKHLLAQKGNPFYLERKKIGGVPHYRFLPFNISVAGPLPEHTLFGSGPQKLHDGQNPQDLKPTDDK